MTETEFIQVPRSVIEEALAKIDEIMKLLPEK